MSTKVPKPLKQPIGASVCLIPVEYAATFFPGYPPKTLERVLHTLGVPLLHDKDGKRFNLYTLEAILHYLLYPGGPGIALPSSHYKNRSYHLRKDATCRKIDVTAEDLEAINSEAWRQARLATGLNVIEPRARRPRRRQPEPSAIPGVGTFERQETPKEAPHGTSV